MAELPEDRPERPTSDTDRRDPGLPDAGLPDASDDGTIQLMDREAPLNTDGVRSTEEEPGGVRSEAASILSSTVVGSETPRSSVEVGETDEAPPLQRVDPRPIEEEHEDLEATIARERRSRNLHFQNDYGISDHDADGGHRMQIPWAAAFSKIGKMLTGAEGNHDDQIWSENLQGIASTLLYGLVTYYFASSSQYESDEHANEGRRLIDSVKGGFLQQARRAFEQSGFLRRTDDGVAPASSTMIRSRPRLDFSKGATTGLPIRRWATDVSLKDGTHVRVIHKSKELPDDVLRAVVDNRQRAQALLGKVERDLERLFKYCERPAGVTAGELIEKSDLPQAAKDILKSVSIAEENPEAYLAKFRKVREAALENQTIKVVDKPLDSRKKFYTFKSSKKPVADEFKVDSYADPRDNSPRMLLDMQRSTPKEKTRVKVTADAIRNIDPKGSGQVNEKSDRAAKALIKGYASASNAGTPVEHRKLSGLGRA